MTPSKGGPLGGVRILELAALGPASFCGMVLADFGAEVTRVDRPQGAIKGPLPDLGPDLLNRGKRSIVIDLQHPEGAEIVLELAAKSDALIEGFRPGITEKLGVGPAHCLARNPRLVYGRMTGWGQEGPLSDRAGHDIDFIALSGVLGSIGGDDPVVPLNLVGDYGGGGMLLAIGVLAGIISAIATGRGQVVDSSMIDGSALLAVSHFGFLAGGSWSDRRADNLLDGGAPFYTVYRTSDSRHIAVGALEPKFFDELIAGLGLSRFDVGDQYDRTGWSRMRELFASTFAQNTRDHWEEVFDGRDACVVPVLRMAEAPKHPHNKARATFVNVAGITQPGPAPRFSATPNGKPGIPSQAGDSTDLILGSLGYSPDDVDRLRGQLIVY